MDKAYQYIKLHWKVISSFVVVSAGAYNLALLTNATISSIDVESLLITNNELIPVFINKSASSLENFDADIFLYYPNEVKNISGKNLGALVAGAGRSIEIPFQGLSIPEKIVICISFSGPYFFDKLWQKVELKQPYKNPITAMHGIYNYVGATTRLGHSFIFEPECN